MPSLPKQKKATLSAKEITLIKALVAGKTKSEAGMLATGSTTPQSGATQAVRMLKSVNVQEALAVEFERQGISLSRAVKPIADALDAEKVHIVGNGEQAMADVVPDHAVRLKASQMALRLMGAEQQQEGGVSVHFHNHQAEQKQSYGL